MNQLDTIATFLHFGYLPRFSQHQLDFLGDYQRWRELKVFLSQKQSSDLIKEGVAILRRTFRDALDRKTSGLHVLPLSGGLDSRAILGGLLENLNTNEILAVTYGTPGTWDYEIGRHVARSAGVRSESIDLTSHDWQWDADSILEIASRLESPTWLLDVYVNHRIPQRYGSDCLYWSGFMGEALTGAHLPPKESKSWEQAISFFVGWNKFSRSLKLTPPGFIPRNTLPTTPWIDREILGYDEQLDFGIRQLCLIRHIVLPAGYDYRTPFLCSRWVEFILNVPRRYREKQLLYKEILKVAYPKLFSLPTKANMGLPLTTPGIRKAMRYGALRLRHELSRVIPRVNVGVAPSVNYIDFDHGLRAREDLRNVIYQNIQGLKGRGLVDWIDIGDIWNRHMHNQRNHADALMLLASLEMYIRAGKVVP
jgi:asparagine synthetase B (glutamine-hydrolysing)